jgi:hypothetical protein
MIERYFKGEKHNKPNVIIFNNVIDAWANTGDERSPLQAEQLLHRMDDLQHLGMERVQPNVHTYSSLMNAWAKQSSNESAVSQVEWLLSNMERQSGQTWDK